MKAVRLSELDLNRATEIHMEAFSDHLNVLLGKKYNRAFLKWFSDDPNTICLVCKEGEAIMGYVNGAAWGYQNQLSKYLLPYAAKAFLTKPGLIFNRRILKVVWIRLSLILGLSQKIKATKINYKGKLISLTGIGVGNDFSGRGVGSILEKEFIEIAKSKGFDWARLSVYSTNNTARKFYEKHGWSLEGKGDTEVVGYYKDLSK